MYRIKESETTPVVNVKKGFPYSEWIAPTIDLSKVAATSLIGDPF